ncbi:MAG: protease [Sphingobacteriales bacterium]|nr:protease [Sphingobacteriales bacterium]MBI3717767.1 protease [Sphingobacteriales bacterium]
MNRLLKTSACLLAAGMLITSCKKNSVTDATTDEVSSDVLAQIKSLGFGTGNVIKEDGGYIVEGDIFLTPSDLTTSKVTSKLVIANEEQYRTTNLVTGLPRVVTVSVTGNVNATFSSAIDAMIARYNALNLRLTFQRAASGGNINIRIVNTGQYIASSGFPSGGNPYSEVKYAKKYSGSPYGLDFITTVLAHEVGHCIGFRHTDYMNRAYSCGTGGNEGDGGVGAIFIPGTNPDPDPNSWMLACLSATTNRPFNANDKTALNYLYK